MKTLDEVIKRIEIYKNIFDKNGCFQCHYHEDDCIDSCFLENVLYYLNTIETTENLYHDAVNELSKLKDEDWKDRCLPLTWDELRQMEGKPVLVVADEKERWRIIREVSSEILILESGLPLHRSWMDNPDGWRAYRKEPKELHIYRKEQNEGIK